MSEFRKQAKEMLEHGEWLPWLERETEFSERSAQTYMRVYREYGAAQGSLFGPEANTQTFADLPISKAIALLSVPESDREVFAEEVDAEHISVRELEQKIREREKQLEALKKDQEGNEKALEEARERIRELSALNDELEHRPVEVAVERDEKAIEEAVKAARAEAEKQNERAQDGLKKQLADAEKQQLDLKERLQKAETNLTAAKAEADRRDQDQDEAIDRATAALREQLAEAKKQLKASSADVAVFGERFSQVQKDFGELMSALQQVNERDPETGGKLKKGAAALLEKLLEQLKVEA